MPGAGCAGTLGGRFRLCLFLLLFYLMWGYFAMKKKGAGRIAMGYGMRMGAEAKDGIFYARQEEKRT